MELCAYVCKCVRATIDTHKIYIWFLVIAAVVVAFAWQAVLDVSPWISDTFVKLFLCALVQLCIFLFSFFCLESHWISSSFFFVSIIFLFLFSHFWLRAVKKLPFAVWNQPKVIFFTCTTGFVSTVHNQWKNIVLDFPNSNRINSLHSHTYTQFSKRGEKNTNIRKNGN